jgi:aspartate-semialdehyde dehydrogenase
MTAQHAAERLLSIGVTPGSRMTAPQRNLLRDRLAGRRIVLVGATGAVGLETLALLDEAGHPPQNVLALASERSEDAPIGYAGSSLRTIAIERALREGQITRSDIVILALSASLARELAPRLRALAALVVDHSSAFRRDPAVPLVIPEINPIRRTPPGTLVASPNCTTTIALIALAPLHTEAGLERISICSYQAVSGAGLAAVAALESETGAALAGRPPEAGRHFPRPIAFNAFPHESPLDPASAHNEEELKLLHESRRILATPALAVEAACVRIATIRSHLVAVRAELTRPATVHALRGALDHAPGLVHDLLGLHLSALDAAGRCDVIAGRLRPADPLADPDAPHRVITLMAAGDQLLKGAAWNGLQIAADAAT